MSWNHFAASTVICSLPLVLAACGGKTPADPRTDVPQVRVAAVQEAAAASLAFTGTIAARVQSDLGFRVSGKLLQRLVDAGQYVKRGQVLMRLDSVDLKLTALAQQAAVVSARAHAMQTAEDEARYRDLRGTGAISSSAYDQVKAAADMAKAQFNAAEAAAEVARNATRYTDLVAEVDGTVTDTLVEPGQVVSAGQTVLRLAHSGRREAVIDLPETLRPALGSMAQATRYGKEGLSVPAKLRQLSNAADPVTRTFEARYVLTGELADAPLGSTVVIQIIDQRLAIQNALQVPIGSLFDAGKGPGVWVVNGDPTIVSWRPIAIQRIDDDSAGVTGQLKSGERIVTIGAHRLHDGERVRVLGETDTTVTVGVSQ